MTGGYIGMGLIAGLGFLLVYLIGKNFIVALVAGLVLLVLAYVFFKPKPEKTKESLSFENSTDYVNMLEDGYRYLANFRSFRHDLGSDPLQEDIGVLIDYCEKIFASIKKTPGNHRTLGDLVNTYLPSLDKILGRYIETQKNKLDGKEANAYVKKTRVFLQELSSVFSKILNEVHDDDIFEATVELETMKMLMQGSGYMELDGFHIPEEEETHEDK